MLHTSIRPVIIRANFIFLLFSFRTIINRYLPCIYWLLSGYNNKISKYSSLNVSEPSADLSHGSSTEVLMLLGGASIVSISLVIIIFCRRRRKEYKSATNEKQIDELVDHETILMTQENLTCNHHESNCLEDHRHADITSMTSCKYTLALLCYVPIIVPKVIISCFWRSTLGRLYNMISTS